MHGLRHWTSRAVLLLLIVLLVAGLAYSFPIDAAFLFAIDLASWVEAAVAVYVVSQVTRIRPIIAYLRARFSGRSRTSQRQFRQRRTSVRREADDDHPAAWTLVLAA
jgi:membrane protein implicated in regulation of membrane protease activity